LLRRIARTARTAIDSLHPVGLSVATELARIAERIRTDGKTTHIDEPVLGVLTAAAADIERDTGAPVGKHMDAAIRWALKVA
jgi:hypothetical protein